MTILTFGITRDIIGSSSLDLAVTEGGISVAELKQMLIEKYPRFKQLASLMIAVNTEYGADDTIIKNNDEVALIPPVAGG
jgi:molybdopterin converting factor subunit 1